MLLLAATLAHAGLRVDLDREARDAPQIAIACTSASGALERLRQAALELADGEQRLPAEMDDFLGGLEAVLAPGARLGVAWWEETSAVRIGFETKLETGALAEALVELSPERAGRAVQSPEGWRVVDPDGAELTVEVTDGWARVTRGAVPAGTARSLPAPLLAALPEDEGCAVAVHVVDDDLGAVDMALHLSLTPDRPATFAAALPALQDSAAILLEGAVPPRASTPEVPEAVLVLGVGLDSIDFSTFLQGKELRQARRLQSWFPVTGGTTVALLGMRPVPRVAAVVPFAGNMPAPRLARRVKRLAKELDLPVHRVDATHLTVRAGNVEVFVSAAPGRLHIANDAGALVALERGEGEPWVDTALQGITARWPLVLTSRALPTALRGAGLDLPRPFLLTVDVQGGVIQGLVDVPLSLEQIAVIGRAVKAARESRRMREAEEAAAGQEPYPPEGDPVPEP